MATRKTPTESRQITRADVDTHRLALRRIEVNEHRIAELECSSESYYLRQEHKAAKRGITTDDLDAEREQETRDKIARVLGYVPLGLFINGDPRGYALKVQPENAGDLEKDWGGYGLLAPDRSKS